MRIDRPTTALARIQGLLSIIETTSMRPFVLTYRVSPFYVPQFSRESDDYLIGRQGIGVQATPPFVSSLYVYAPPPMLSLGKAVVHPRLAAAFWLAPIPAATVAQCAKEF